MFFLNPVCSCIYVRLCQHRLWFVCEISALQPQRCCKDWCRKWEPNFQVILGGTRGKFVRSMPKNNAYWCVSYLQSQFCAHDLHTFWRANCYHLACLLTSRKFLPSPPRQHQSPRSRSSLMSHSSSLSRARASTRWRIGGWAHERWFLWRRRNKARTGDRRAMIWTQPSEFRSWLFPRGARIPWLAAGPTGDGVERPSRHSVEACISGARFKFEYATMRRPT